MAIRRKKNLLAPVFPNISEWPIFKLSEDRANFIAEIDHFTTGRLMHKHGGDISNILAKAIYMERIRVKEEPWKVDPQDERVFWNRLQKRMVEVSAFEEEEKTAACEKMLHTIVHRYSEEIVGTFKIGTFMFARRFLTFFFNRLLNTAASRNFKRIWSSKHKLEDSLFVAGELEMVRNLMKKGTVVMLPTHFSNLDSILIGYAMDTFAGLPSFSYGAGLNLYNTGYTAYFMNRLGAYRVDRRKRNPIYLETLKAMSNLSLQRGVNSLFFPGGTRSRNGAIEQRLKLGLLGTVVEAQRTIYQRGSDQKIFVVPMVMSYNFVLEAKYLIEQYLRRMGKEKYMRIKDAFLSVRKQLKFAWNVFSVSSEITVSFGQPLDVLGNFVDNEGISYDSKGNRIDVSEYFVGNNQVESNLQREHEYTRILSERVVERFHADNIVLSSHLVAFAAFLILQRQNLTLDLYGVLRLPSTEYYFPGEVLEDVVFQLKERLHALNKAGKVKLSAELDESPEFIIRDGISKLGLYHAFKPLKYDKRGRIVSQDFKLLFYYHNRMTGYDLENDIKWKIRPIELEKAMAIEE